ncbi:MAG: SGNH/GDSL hydrolase family protein [Alistipes sp.]|nr:SGNH/GDSL hydrolase family protein [Alistipes sp.]
MKKLLSVLAMVCLVLGASAQPRKARTCNLIFIGNSITEGALHANKKKTAPPVVAANLVGNMLSMDVHYRNCGRSGATTVDFLPEQKRDFVRVEKAIEEIKALSYAPILFSIMLGTNDSANFGPNGSPVSNEDYKKNLMTMIGRIRELCPNAIFILQRPIWYSPNTHNASQYLVAGQKRMVAYTDVLIEIANENDDVYLGDRDAFDYFGAKHRKYMFAEDGKAGTFYLHPNEAGARKLARYWAQAIVKVVKKNL